MNPNTVLTRSDDVTFQVVADEAILIRLDTGTYFSLNKVGTQFWQMLDGQQTIGQHAAAVANQYQVDGAMVTADFVELAAKLAAEKLVF